VVLGGGLRNKDWVAGRWASMAREQVSGHGSDQNGLTGHAREKEKKIWLFQNKFLFNAELHRKPKKYLETSEKYETFSGDRLAYLAQLLCWALWAMVNKIKMKNGFQIWTLNLDRIWLNSWNLIQTLNFIYD
jgi:hypothetical protein